MDCGPEEKCRLPLRIRKPDALSQVIEAKAQTSDKDRVYSATDSILVTTFESAQVGGSGCFCIRSSPYFAWRLTFSFGSQFIALC